MDSKPTIISPDTKSPEPTASTSPSSNVSTPEAAPPVSAKHAHKFIVSYLFLIILVAALGGVYTWQHKKVTDANAKVASLQTQVTSLLSQVNKLSKQTQSTSVSLPQAVAQTQAVYALFSKDVLGGQVLKDKSSWASNNADAAEDLQFINANPSLFTSSFITAANKDETNDVAPTGGEFFMCENGSADFNSNAGFQVIGNSLNGQTAKVTLSYTINASTSTTYSIPVTLQYVGNSWKVDIINLSSCGQ